jgi:hypothetical protein
MAKRDAVVYTCDWCKCEKTLLVQRGTGFSLGADVDEFYVPPPPKGWCSFQVPTPYYTEGRQIFYNDLLCVKCNDKMLNAIAEAYETTKKNNLK